jgi:hypothetical protein
MAQKNMPSQSLASFAQQVGNMKLATCKDSKGKSFISLAYTRGGETNFLNLSKKLSHWTEAQVMANLKNLQVGFTETEEGKPYMVLFLPGENSWKDIMADLL